MSRVLTVSSPSRLHFGLAAFAPTTSTRGYGGIGAMVAASRVELTFEAAVGLQISGNLRERVAQVCRNCLAEWNIGDPNLRITVTNLPGHHAGLGLGTQLALSVARGLATFLERPPLNAGELARLTGRGRRSSVGTYGNLMGGLIVDGGKAVGENIGRLTQRVAMPADWRFLLARPPMGQGVSGEIEARAFAKLPPIAAQTTCHLMQLATDEIAPACQAGDFDRFANAVGEYGKIAGGCFANVQGGLFASPDIARTASQLAEAGARGVGQSSWGPTVFGMAPTSMAAQSIVDGLGKSSDALVEVAAPDNTGMRAFFA